MIRDGVIKKTTLCFLFNRKASKLLMILKKRGQGAGKWNVPGGKIHPGETAEQGAIRECQEETGLLPSDLKQVGILEFYFPESNSWDNICQVFISEKFSGTLVNDNEECSAQWIDINKIPFDQMWDDDKLWIPLLLANKTFHRVYFFDSADHMKEERILESV